MNNNNVFGKVVVDTAGHKREKFPLNYQNSTSMDFGEVQPLGCTLLKPQSHTTINGKHLVRLDPMVAPSVGSIKQKTWHHFVGMSELSRKFSAFLTKSTVTGAANNPLFVPGNMLYANTCDISALCLIGADYSIYVWDANTSTDADDPSSIWQLLASNDSGQVRTDIRDWLNNYVFTPNGSMPSCFPGFRGGIVNLNKLLGAQYNVNAKLPCGRESVDEFFNRPLPFDASSASTGYEEVPLNSPDYVVRQNMTVYGRSYKLAVAIRLSAFGKRVRKFLIGCGYRINFLMSKNRSLMPLFATYKAYFDTFGLTLWNSWESSYAKLILERFDSNVQTSFGLDSTNVNDQYFMRFVYDIGNCYATEEYDYISAHQQHDVEPRSFGTDPDRTRGFVNNIVLDTPGSTNGRSGIGQDRNVNINSSETGHVYINRANHTQVDADLLKILYKWTNRETVAGKRIAELLRAGGYGKYVDEQKSNFIGYEELSIDIVDINATADGVNTQVGVNSALGEYVGKGVGVTKNEDRKTFSFDNDEFGFWVTLSAIIPESGYCQGFDPKTEAISPDDFYSEDFDAVGFELESKDIVLGETPWQNPLDSNEVAAYSSTFGGVPRHTRWKVKQNIVNGDIDLKSTRTGNLPFMLDKFISLGDRDCVLVSGPGATFKTYRAIKGLGVDTLPVAGEPWRYLNRYQWLNNFVRIFADFGNDAARFQKVMSGALSPQNYEYVHYQKDHFQVFNWFDFVTYSGMKPIAESYGTTDDNDGNGDMTMSRA